MAHVEQRARAERAHVVGRDVGVAGDDSHGFGRHVEHLADDLRHAGVGTLPHIDRGNVKRRAAVGADIDDGDRGGRRHARLERKRNAAAALQGAAAAIELFLPAQSLGDVVEDRLERRVFEDGAGCLRAAVAQHIGAAEFDRIDVERPRHHVGMALIGEGELRHAETAQRAGRRHVGVHGVGIDPDIVDVVGTAGGEAGFMRHARADVRIRSAVPEHLAFARGDAARLVDAALDADRRRMLGDLIKLLFHGQRDLDRPARDHRARRHQRFELDVKLAAIAAAEIRDLDAHLVFRPAQQPRDLGAHEGWALRARVDRQAGLLVVGDRAERLERHVQAFLRAEFVLEHMRRVGKGFVGVATPRFGLKRQIGVLDALEMLQVGEAAGGFELVVHMARRRHRLDLVVDRLELLVFGGDRLDGSVRHMRIGSEHHRDRLTDEADFVHGQDGLIVERRTVIGIGDNLDDVCGSNDAEHAGDFLRRADVDRLDAAMRHRRAEDLAIKHAGQPHQMGIFGAPGDLFARFEPRYRAADLAAAYRIGRHRQ